jgi:hypothetical protein
MRLQLAALLLLCAGPAHADWRHAADTLIYVDDDHVTVVSPRASSTVELDDQGGKASAAVTVDVVSAASVDVISQATPGFHETRAQLDLSASKAYGDWLPELSLSLSLEEDYQSYGVGLGGRRTLAGGDTTLALVYRPLYDLVGRHESEVREPLWTHTVEGSWGQNLDARTVSRLTLTLVGQAGELAKPYRHVPLFDQAGVDRARADGVELDLDTFDDYRLDARPPERVPDTRLRAALGARVRRWFARAGLAAGADYRFYLDSWRQAAHTVTLEAEVPLGDHLTLGLTARGHLQDAVSFWRRAYVVAPGSVPGYRTVDRELGAQHSLYLAERLSWHAGAWAAHVDAGVLFSRFDDFMFLDRRRALLLVLGVRWTP